jgi:diaminohydroxyphosphoribosylaminopyrimidine deaminase/5-amino-6-(5-phosphoribosylamino)uracil reductase
VFKKVLLAQDLFCRYVAWHKAQKRVFGRADTGIFNYNIHMNTHHLQTALQLAEHAIGLSSPNPRVGCVLVRDLVQGEQIIGQGFTQAAGSAHAEVMAIRDAQAKRHETIGATAYVTLEPCSHHGRTPPCVDALIKAQVAKVVVACLDPNPQVAGKGVANLRRAGIEVTVLPPEHPIAQAAYDLNIGFMTRMTHGKVFTRMKWAQSADGKTALPDGRSQWITGAPARVDGHRYRARADAIVTGVGTVLHDDPQLNVRGVTVAVAHSPVKYIIDTWANTPVHAKLFDDNAAVCIVCAELPPEHPLAGALSMRIELLSQTHAGIRILRLPTQHFTEAGNDLTHERIDLRALWQHFFERSFNEIHVEAGATLNASLLELGLVDELLIYLAPRVIGAGLPTAQFAPNVNLDNLIQAGAWRWVDVGLVGDDARMVLRKNP